MQINCLKREKWAQNKNSDVSRTSDDTKMLFCSFFVCNSRKSISIKRKSLFRHLENADIKNYLNALTNLAKILIRI